MQSGTPSSTSATAVQRTLIATRESRLALWQAEHVRALLVQRFGMTVELLGMTTRGDQILDRTLSKVGGKGLFVKELEAALEEGRAQLAVHSLKDVPMDLPAGFELAAVLEREDPRDVFVSPRYRSLADLPQGATVGTSSLRRVVQLGALALFNRIYAGHYLLVTAAAIEVTLLHNFVWHVLYTWRDRRGYLEVLGSLLRFHLSNGVISMVGNLALMRLLVREGR